MNNDTLKVVIPMAGLGTRLRPHTWSRPKQLVGVAGKTVLDHLIASLSTLPGSQTIEVINIVGYLGDQIESHFKRVFPDLKAHYVVQENPRGQSHALWLAREYLNGPMLVIFADTLIDTDLSFLATEEADAVALVKPVPDPRRFGVAEVGSDNWVVRLIEKPKDMNNNLALVGFYYFRNGEQLVEAIEEQMERDIGLKGEFYLVDAINIMLQNGIKMRTRSIDVWLDAGTPEALLETNRYLLQNGRDNSQDVMDLPSAVVIPPVFIHPTAQVNNSIIGPNVSIGANCLVEHSIISDSILEEEACGDGIILEQSLVGRNAKLYRRAGMINAGDNTVVTL